MLKDILSHEECAALCELIDEARGVVVCCHTNPDGDVLGGCDIRPRRECFE